ncbi:MAG: class I poly(R)-hydroxyalkanoic acid synthase [Herminiimonas sp.]|nr:class I poly(R)-hydroxyalkanoic acid synthase [Herminiimonas sp.]
MNTPNPQSTQPAFPDWMAQLANPAAWNSFMQAPQVDAAPLVAQIGQMGAAIDPAVATKLQSDYMQEFSVLWQDLAQSKSPPLGDKRFGGSAWSENPLYAFNAAAYLLNSRFLTAMADAVQATPKAKQKIRFAVQQMVDAMSPANFLATNPEAQRKIVETKGESLSKGIALMLADMKKGRISQTDENAFEVGTNVATTEGAVVFENELFQLIQYKPLTKTVYKTPLLLVPPCINKFYIMDLQPENSLVRYAVEQGHTVFLTSWRNADKSMSQVTWDDYIEQGTIKAIDVVKEISGQEKINALGFCVGGTLLATGLAVLAARRDNPIASLTLLTSFLDFSDTGVIDVFIDEMQVKMREQAIGKGGLMAGRDFASAFSSLRSNDLVWNYVGSNYLKGVEPPPFDLLYWNADSTNLPGPMFCWYLRNTYLENNLSTPGKVTVCGEKIDFGKIDAPTFLYASREDHIVPWMAAYSSMALLNPGKIARNQFVLGASGHIAGVINPASKNKRSHWINQQPASDAQAWFDGATEMPGSWWPQWDKFLVSHAGKMGPVPRKFGNDKYKPIEPAPGRYVKAKAD